MVRAMLIRSKMPRKILPASRFITTCLQKKRYPMDSVRLLTNPPFFGGFYFLWFELGRASKKTGNRQ
ncbi:hypothetical protein SAMN04515620_15423, partial [Collimonas sp. OK607]